MKKNFPMLLLRIGGVVALLGVAALVLMLIVKLVVTALLLLGIGTILFKIVSHRRRQYWNPNDMQLTAMQEQRIAKSKIEPIFQRNSNKDKTIIPIL
ncbi:MULTISPECIES: hypothetical protein [Chitinophagaceae]